MRAARRTAIAVASVSLLASGVVGARASVPGIDTACALGGPTPGARIVRLDLPGGAADVSLSMSSTTPTGRRLAEGVFLLTARTHRLIAFRIAVNGMTSSRVGVRAGGLSVADSAYPGPALPFARTAGTPVPGLAPGSYYVVGFGTGSARTQWSAGIAVNGSHRCTVVGGGRTVSLDASQWASGSSVTAPGAGVIDGARTHWRTERPLVVGVLQATQEVAGQSTLDYRTPTGHGTVTNDIEPFVSVRGRYRFAAHTEATIPMIAVEAAAIAVPAHEPSR